jgi:hypothetical protein
LTSFTKTSLLCPFSCNFSTMLKVLSLFILSLNYSAILVWVAFMLSFIFSIESDIYFSTVEYFSNKLFSEPLITFLTFSVFICN